MNELIKIHNYKDKELVNARDLYAMLEIKTDFNNWVKRIIRKFKLELNKHYIVFVKKDKNSKGGRPSSQYGFTLDVAHMIALSTNTDIGDQITKYVAKKLTSEIEKSTEAVVPYIPDTYSGALQLAAEKQKYIEENTHKINYADHVKTDGNDIPLKIYAQQLCNEYNVEPFGIKKMYTCFRELGYVQKGKRIPTQRYIDNGYLKTHVKAFNQRSDSMTMVTPLGQVKLAEKVIAYFTKKRHNE